MANNSLFSSGAARDYARALLRHHYLSYAGRSDEVEVEVIESRMSALWEQLTTMERDFVRGISSDLNWLRRGYEPPPRGRKEEEIPKQERDTFLQLVSTTDQHLGNPAAQFERALEILPLARACAPSLPPLVLALVRANCYSNLGFREISEPFLRATIDLAIHDSNSARAAFDLLVHVSPQGAYATSARVVRESDRYPPLIVAMATTFIDSYVGTNFSEFISHDLVSNLIQASKRLDDEPTPHYERIRFYLMAAAQLIDFGHEEEGKSFLLEAERLKPTDPDLLAWLGEAAYKQDPKRAIPILELATRAGTRQAGPYLILATHNLIDQNYPAAENYAQQLTERTQDPAVTAIGYEIGGICLAERGDQQDAAQTFFAIAMKLAPNNKRIAYNYRVFQQKTKERATINWITIENEFPISRTETWFESPRLAVSA